MVLLLRPGEQAVARPGQQGVGRPKRGWRAPVRGHRGPLVPGQLGHGELRAVAVQAQAAGQTPGVLSDRA